MSKESNMNRWLNPRRWAEILIAAALAVGGQELTEKHIGKWSLGVFSLVFFGVSIFFENSREKQESLEKENKVLKENLYQKSDIVYRTNHAERIKSESEVPSPTMKL